MKNKKKTTVTGLRQAFLGVDISKGWFHAALLLPDGRLLEKQLRNESRDFPVLRHWVEKHAAGLPVHAVMEATGVYYEELALALHPWIKTVSVVNPWQIKSYANSSLRRAKTDAVDAQTIARYAAAQSPVAWLPPTPAQRELQELTRRLQSLVASRTAETNRLQSARTALSKASMQRLLAALEKEITQIEADIAAVVAQDPHLRAQEQLLRTIPGIGAATAAKILAEVPSMERFTSARQLGAHAGLTPKRNQSGSSVNRLGGICRIGSSRLRSCLFYPAMVACRHNAPLITFAARLRAAGKPPKLIITAVMRKLLHMVFGVLTSKKPFNPLILQKSTLNPTPYLLKNGV